MDLNTFTVKQLIVLAGNYTINVPKGIKKAELVDLINEYIVQNELLQGTDTVVTDDTVQNESNLVIENDDQPAPPWSKISEPIAPVINDSIFPVIDDTEAELNKLFVNTLTGDNNQNDDNGHIDRVTDTVTDMVNSKITEISNLISHLQDLMNLGNYEIEPKLTAIYHNLGTLIPNYEATKATKAKTPRSTAAASGDRGERLRSQKGAKWVQLTNLLRGGTYTLDKIMQEMDWTNRSTSQTYIQDIKTAYGLETTFTSDGTRQYTIPTAE